MSDIHPLTGLGLGFAFGKKGEWGRNRGRRITLSLFTRLSLRSQVQKRTSGLVEISSGPFSPAQHHSHPFHRPPWAYAVSFPVLCAKLVSLSC